MNQHLAVEAESPELPEAFVTARATGELLLSTARLMAEVIARCAAPEGLTAMEARALRYLRDALPQRELAERLGCDAPRVTAITRRLAERGFIRRAMVEDDRRVRLAELTEEGLAASMRISRRLGASSPLVRGFTVEETQDLEVVLQRLSDAARGSLREMRW